MSEFRKIKVGESEYTALRFGIDGYEIPQHILQSVRKDGILVTDDGIKPFPWYGITKDTDGQYILLPPVSLSDIREIAGPYRDRALRIVRKLTLGLSSLSPVDLDLLTGVMPLYRIYIEGKDNVVILPSDAGSVLTLSRTPEEMDRDVRSLIAPDRETGYTLTLEMAELLYMAVSGRLPYEDSSVRGSGFHPYPLSLYTAESPVSSFIMKILEMKEKDQRKLCLNKGVTYPLGWFLDETSELEWALHSRSDADRIFDIKTAEESEGFRKLNERKSHRSGRNRLIREKGLVTIVIILIVALAGYFIGNFLYQKFKAPVTKDMTPTEIIEYTISCQNRLDATGINEGFRGNAAQYSEVTSLYVTSKTRYAYEGLNIVVSVDDWLSSGESAIDSESFVYGAVIESIEDEGDNTYTAALRWYTPYAFSDDEDEGYPEEDGYARIYVYSISETFVFEWNSRGWWQCTSSSFSDDTLLDVLYIPYKTTALEQSPDTGSI